MIELKLSQSQSFTFLFVKCIRRGQLQLIFGVRPPQRMQNFMGRWQRHKTAAELRTKTKSSCGSLCCCGCSGLGTRLSVSSSSASSASSYDIVSSGTEPLQTLSSLAHAMVQERLSRMIDEERRRVGDGGRWRRQGDQGCIGAGKVIILVAMDKSSYEPRRDFKESMMEVITSKGLEEPKELRSLLNCYISMNPREQRQTILEAFHECIPLRFEILKFWNANDEGFVVNGHLLKFTSDEIWFLEYFACNKPSNPDLRPRFLRWEGNTDMYYTQDSATKLFKFLKNNEHFYAHLKRNNSADKEVEQLGADLNALQNRDIRPDVYPIKLHSPKPKKIQTSPPPSPHSPHVKPPQSSPRPPAEPPLATEWSSVQNKLMEAIQKMYNRIEDNMRKRIKLLEDNLEKLQATVDSLQYKFIDHFTHCNYHPIKSSLSSSSSSSNNKSVNPSKTAPPPPPQPPTTEAAPPPPNHPQQKQLHHHPNHPQQKLLHHHPNHPQQKLLHHYSNNPQLKLLHHHLLQKILKR
ncbi:hypothetical protein IEQ34_012091 [Dendrobium chrysotoxum]|uniref:OVATE domain-containing protein n=1 Tax=Dendrobium chrysotoxum TaxID=161865 RepID=A0AAV7GSZ2_DENCH|nr:hypothetical protein IEQ34_012091 [Dendrobium chrysotoxum]